MTSEQERTFRFLCGAVIVAGLIAAAVPGMLIVLN